jgi:Nif-specific regulatory protein
MGQTSQRLKDRSNDMAEKNNEIFLKKEDLDLLYEVSTSIHSIHDLDEMLRKVLLKIKEVFQIEGASIALHDPQQKEFYFIRTVEEQKNGTAEQMAAMRFADNYGVAGWVLREKEPVLIPDVSNKI